MKFSEKLVNLIKSVKLAVILIVIIIIFSILASLVPQDLEDVFYLEKYPAPLAKMILVSHFHHFFTSLLFLIPVLILFVNLLFCTISRLVKQLRIVNRKKRFGPDVIHAGLLLILLGGLISLFSRGEGFKWVIKGDTVQLNNHYALQIQKVDYQEYEDGRPKEYTTSIQVLKDGKRYGKVIPIEVNKPLKVDNIRVYQSSFNEEDYIYLVDKEGKDWNLQKGKLLFTNSGSYYFRGIHYQVVDDQESQEDTLNVPEPVIYLDKVENHQIKENLTLKINDKVDEFIIKDVSTIQMSGLNFVIDYGNIPVWIGIGLLFAGLCWTYLQKLLEKKE